MQTLADRRKLSKTKSKIIDLEKQKRGFQPELHNQVLDFYRRDDVSIALPGKIDVKKIGKKNPVFRNEYSRIILAIFTRSLLRKIPM